MLIFKPTKYQDMDVCPELNEVVQAVFSTTPSLEFHACHSRTWGVDTQSFIDGVEVFDGEQKVGKLEWTHKYTRNGYIKVYRITSKRIIKTRGDKNSKTTESAKSAINIAKKYFVRDSDGARAQSIFAAVKNKYNEIIWHYNQQFDYKARQLHDAAIRYLVDTVEGKEPTIDPAIVQHIKSESFTTAKDNYRIAQSVHKSLDSSVGVILYVDRNEKLTMVELDGTNLKKIESTYDLPKNYQEKYTMLKIMEYKQPIEGIGIKLDLKVDDKEGDYYYLVPGDVIITH